MTNRQKIELRMSEVRSRLNAISGLEGDALTDEVKAETQKLTKEYQGLEVRFQAAVTAAGETAHQEQTAEQRQEQELVQGASLGRIVDAVIEHRQVDGREAELQKHFGLGANQIPVEMLMGDRRGQVEHRTTGVTPAPSDVGLMQRPIIPAVFPMSAAAFLGIPQPTVGVGEALYTVLSTSASPGLPAKGAEQDHSTGAFTPTTLSPSRIQASLFFAREDRARLAGIEQALRANLSESLMDKLDEVVLDNLLTGTTLTANAATAADTFNSYRERFAFSHVDGIRAGTVADIRAVVGGETYSSMASKFRGNSSDIDALAALMRETGGVRVSSHAPAVASSKQNGVVRIGNRMDAVTPIWQGISFIVDEVTQAKAGEIVLTAVMLYANTVLRTAGFAKVEAQHA